MSQLAKLFELNWAALDVRRGVAVTVVVGVLTAVVLALGQQSYLLSVTFAVLFVGMSDPGGEYGYRIRAMAVVGLVGAFLTALGFASVVGPWGYAVLATFVVTLLGGLARMFGWHRFVSGLLLNIWFLVALGQAALNDREGVQTQVWMQALAWVIGSALWIIVTLIFWLVRGRKQRPAPFPFPADTSRQKLTRPVFIFALARALALSIAVAIAFGLHLPDASWLPVATIIAMKPTVEQTVLVAEQRLVGAIMGAALACLVVLTVDDKLILLAAMAVLSGVEYSFQFVNYAVYSAAVSAYVLIAMDLSVRSDPAAEEQRVLYTLIGVGIGVAVTLIANRLQCRGASEPLQAT